MWELLIRMAGNETRLGIRYNEKVKKEPRNNALRESEGKQKETSLTTVEFWAEPRKKTPSKRCMLRC